MLKRSIAICERNYGTDHPEVARGRWNLADVYYGTGRFADAETEYRRAIAIQERVLGREHSDLTWILEGLARTLRSTNREGEAALLDVRAAAIRAKHAQENPTR